MNMENPGKEAEAPRTEPRSFAERKVPIDLGEIGTTGIKISGGRIYESRLENFKGSRRAIVIREMYETDATVRGLLSNFTMLGRNTDYSVVTEGTSAEDKRAVEHVEQCLEDMEASFEDYMGAFFQVLPFGHVFHEINLKMRQGEEPPPRVVIDDRGNQIKEEAWPSLYDDGLVGWAGWPARKQDTISRWAFTKNGRVKGAYQRVDYGEGVARRGEQFIPKEKAIHITTNAASGNPEGESILEPVYRSWFFRRNFEELIGIGVKRDLVGYPVMSFPKDQNIWLETNTQKLAKAEALIANLYRDELEGLVKPDDVLLELLKSPGQPRFDIEKLMNWLRLEIAIGTLTEFALVGHEGSGSLALKREATRVFMLALDGVLKNIAAAISKQAIRPLIKANQFNVTSYPYIKFSSVDVPAVESIIESLGKLAQAGAEVFPDYELKKDLYAKLQLPEPEEEDVPDVESEEEDMGTTEEEAAIDEAIDQMDGGTGAGMGDNQNQ